MLGMQETKGQASQRYQKRSAGENLTQRASSSKGRTNKDYSNNKKNSRRDVVLLFQSMLSGTMCNIARRPIPIKKRPNPL